MQQVNQAKKVMKREHEVERVEKKPDGSSHIRNMVPLIRRHFDFLMLEFGFECTRTWNEYMSRYQGVEYKRADLAIQVEQPDSPILEVRVLDKIEGKKRVRDLRKIAGEEVWSKWPEGFAWARPLEQDEKALQFLAANTKEVLPGLLKNSGNHGL